VRGGKASSAFSPARPADVLDGLSNTVMLGEKFVDPTRYLPMPLNQDPPSIWGPLSFTDMGYYQGWSWSTLRCSMAGPVRDMHLTNIAYWQVFGSAHSGGINAVLADGSVRALRYNMSNPVFQVLCRKSDGIALNLSGL
jgi:prepilin-type processing-associated H-X9-DG protein